MISFPSTVESSRDFLAGCLSLGTQSAGIGLSAFHFLRSLFRKKRTDNYKTILITGASSGIGKALALQFASTGTRNLILLGRNGEKLDLVARDCTGLGNTVLTMTADFSKEDDLAAVSTFIRKRNLETPIDLVIANAGMMIHNATGSVDPENQNTTNPSFMKAIIDTNVNGCLATFMPILDSMKMRNSGHIVLLSSINAYLGPSNQYLYSATKSFVRILGQDLGQQLRREKSDVLVSVVAPGLIDTNMTIPFWDSDDSRDLSSAPRKTAQDPKKFAEKIYKGIVRGDRFLTYPYYQFYQSFLGGTLPPSVRDVALCAFTSTGFAGQRTT